MRLIHLRASYSACQCGYASSKSGAKWHSFSAPHPPFWFPLQSRSTTQKDFIKKLKRHLLKGG